MKKILLIVIAIVIYNYSLYSQNNISSNLKNKILKEAQHHNNSILEIKKITQYEFLKHISIVEFSPTGWCIISPKSQNNYRVGYNYNQNWVLDIENEEEVSWIKLFDKAPQKTKSTRTKTEDTQKIEPLIKTKWGQSCMPDGLWAEQNKPVSGCVATAMAQTIKFFEYPKHGHGTLINQNRYGSVNTQADFNDEYDYANMPLGTDCNDAKKELLFECGVLAQAYYGANETAANVSVGLKNMAKYLNYSDYNIGGLSNSDSHARIMESLTNNLPIIVAGFQGKSGHAFILDGYDGNGGYHLNLGWRGYKNGYYTVENMMFKEGFSLYYGLRPLKQINTFPYNSDLSTLADWNYRGKIETGEDNEDHHTYMILDNSKDDMELMYEAPKDQKNLTLVIDLHSIVDENSNPNSDYNNLTIKMFDYFEGQITEKIIFRETIRKGYCEFKNKRLITNLTNNQGHLLKFTINTYTSGGKAPKVCINSFKIDNISNSKITKATASNEYIELTFSKEIKKGTYNPNYFKIKHGSFNYEANKVELPDNKEKSNILRIFSQYKIKKGDNLNISYIPLEQKDALVDSDNLCIINEDKNHKVENNSTVENKAPYIKFITNDNKKAHCKLEIADDDNDKLKLTIYYDTKVMKLEEASENTYYVTSDLKSIKGKFLYVMAEDFTKKNHIINYTFTGEENKTDGNDNNNDDNNNPNNDDNNDNNNDPNNDDNNSNNDDQNNNNNTNDTTSKTELTKAIAHNNYIELNFSKEIKKGEYNTDYFVFKHGSFTYKSTKIKLPNNIEESKTLQIYSAYKFKKGDIITISYVPNSSSGSLIDCNNKLLEEVIENFEVENKSKVINKTPYLKIVENDNDKALYKILVKDDDNDLLKITFDYNKEEMNVKEAGSNFYYIFSDLESLEGKILYAKIIDFTVSNKTMQIKFPKKEKPDNDDNNPNNDNNNNDDGEIIITDVDNITFEQIKVYPNPTSNNFKLNKNCDVVSIYNVSGKLIKSLKNYTKGSSININTLNKGIYIIEIINKNTKTHFKLIKN